MPTPRRLLARLAALAGLAIALLGCDDSAGGACQRNTECELPLSCIEGQCQLECRVSRDCPRGQTCFENACYPPPTSCRVDDECAPFEQICDTVVGQCVSRGGAACHPTLNPCDPGQTCRNGVCRLPTEGDGGPQPVWDATVRPDARTPADASSPADMSPPRADRGPSVDQGRPPADVGTLPDAGPPPDMGPRPGVRQHGEVCRCGSECESGLCVENKLRATRTCTSRCANDFACPGLETCVEVEGGGPTAACPDPAPGAPEPGERVGVCIPNETGYPCDPARAQCTLGYCVTPPTVGDVATPQPTCTVPCMDNSKCPFGFSCQQIGVIGPDGRQEQRRLCAPEVRIHLCPVPDNSGCGGTCPGVTPQQEANVTYCFGAREGICTCSCRDARDCPTGFACGAHGESPDPARPGICFPISGYRCVAGAPDQCSYGCLPIEPVGYCTVECRGGQDCPDNYECMPIDNGGACAPADRD